jgi:uncharacterized protein YjbI with pentapeptide repeats
MRTKTLNLTLTSMIALMVALPASTQTTRLDQPAPAASPFAAPKPAAQAQGHITAVQVKAPATQTPSAGGDDLGNHIATRVLNMNGLNITNVADPFFEGDAVSLSYFNEHNGWSHKADKDIDMSGFGLLNVGSIDLKKATLEGGAYRKSDIATSTISDSTITNSIITRATIDKSEFTSPILNDAELKAPAINGMTAKGGTISDMEIRDSRLSNVDIDGLTVTGFKTTAAELEKAKLKAPEVTGGTVDKAKLTDSTLSGKTVFDGEVIFSEGVAFNLGAASADTLEVGTLVLSEPLQMSGKGVTGLPDAKSDTDAVNLRTAERLIEDRLSGANSGLEEIETLNARIDDLIEQQKAAAEEETTSEVALTSFRPTPPLSDALGQLMADDAAQAISKVKSIVYELPEGGFAVGVDPESIPPELRFVVRKNSDGGFFAGASVDYAQMIGPMVAAIQHLSAQVEDLETRIEAGK